MKRLLTLCVLFGLSASALAQSTALPELALVGEYPVEGLRGANLSGLAHCQGELLAVSDRDDRHLYRLDTAEPVWQARAEPLAVPKITENALPWGLRMRNQAYGVLRGGDLDFEGITCDQAGNRYLVSEGYAAVLKVSPSGAAEWLRLPRALFGQARASGMLVRFNALFEGVAIDPAGKRLWLAAERERRGLMVVHEQGGRWQCHGGCVLLAENALLASPANEDTALPLDFSDLALFEGKLFTLERLARRICRRSAQTGQEERCWSFAATALAPERRYGTAHGVAEALVIDADGAWVGVDSNGLSRADGESRPVVWRLAAPRGGWGSRR